MPILFGIFSACSRDEMKHKLQVDAINLEAKAAIYQPCGSCPA
jgi:hypothetical protein